MKIALLFAGRIKAWQHCYASFQKYILEPLSGWQVDGFLCHNAENELPEIDRFIELYKIRKWTNSTQSITISESALPLNLAMNGNLMSLKMYAFWSQAYSLMESYDESYDAVLYLRADAVFTSPFILPTLPLPDDTLYVPVAEDWTGLNDQCALGSTKVMRHYTNLVNEVITIFENTRTPFHTETYVKLHNSIFTLVRFRFDFSLHPMRR